MRTFILLTLLLFSFDNIAQTKATRYHTLDSCNKCHCYKWHQTIDKDSVDNSKIIFKYRVRRGSGSQCASDEYTKYYWVTTKYYPDGKIKSIKKEKGWQNGFGGDSKTTTIYFDKQGKETNRTT